MKEGKKKIADRLTETVDGERITNRRSTRDGFARTCRGGGGSGCSENTSYIYIEGERERDVSPRSRWILFKGQTVVGVLICTRHTTVHAHYAHTGVYIIYVVYTFFGVGYVRVHTHVRGGRRRSHFGSDPSGSRPIVMQWARPRRPY